MNPACARCGKTVYPVEKLNCLDSIWHKGCFNCETCHMTLSMKTYKGYKKLPYCNAHYPTTKPTAVADTPENLRLKKNTANQSSVVYHKDFNQEKGKFNAVADDPETLRTRKVQQQASDLSYQGGARNTVSAPMPVDPIEPVAPPPIQEPAKPQGRIYVAQYDYTAADDDEVSFNEGDIIINGEIIDEGWMNGTVERTGETGMLPSNYVEAQ